MKTLEQSVDEARAVRILRALANPVRYRIVQLLAARDACVCGDLVDELPLAQSTVSEHLKVLKDAGIVQGIIEGPNTCYCLDPEALRFLHETLAALEQRACC
jgi:DNA-binding transcriptional ArsR family regulator